VRVWIFTGTGRRPEFELRNYRTARQVSALQVLGVHFLLFQNTPLAEEVGGERGKETCGKAQIFGKDSNK
jgi:hypothetical protein